MPQRPYLFHGSVAENPRLARPTASMAEIVAVTEAAAAHAFIATLPQGYDTPIGERSARLSGGQAQRLALARAILKDAPVLLLDEPTANLDARTEQVVLRSLGPLMNRRTTLMITHRLASLEEHGHYSGARPRTDRGARPTPRPADARRPLPAHVGASDQIGR